jgi:hypothetical protein
MNRPVTHRREPLSKFGVSAHGVGQINWPRRYAASQEAGHQAGSPVFVAVTMAAIVEAQ